MNAPAQEDFLSKNLKIQKVAIEQVYNYCYPRLTAYIGQRPEGHLEVNDILQDAVAVAYQNVKSGKYEQKAAISSYVLSIAKKIWLYGNRSESRLQKENKDINAITSQDESNGVIKLQLLQNVLTKLSDECQEVLKSHYHEGISMQEMAEKYELSSEQAARNKKWRCLKCLSEIVKSHKLTKEDFYSK